MELKEQSKLIKKLQEGLNIPEGLIFKVTGSKKGVPDICFVFNNETYWIECKMPSGSFSKEQKVFLENTNNAFTVIFMSHETVITVNDELYTIDDFIKTLKGKK